MASEEEILDGEMADKVNLDPLAAKLAAEMSSKTSHSVSKRQMPTPSWIATEIKEETMYCLNCSYCSFGIDGLKRHMGRQHPGTAAVVSNCSGEEFVNTSSPNVTFFCVRKTCSHSSAICYVYEDHLMGCCSLPLDLTQEEKESLTASLEFLLDFHIRHNFRIASGFLQFVSSLPEGISISSKFAHDNSEEQEVNDHLTDTSDVNHKEKMSCDDSQTSDVAQHGSDSAQNLDLHVFENQDISEGEAVLMSTESGMNFCADSATDQLDGSSTNVTNDCGIKVLHVEGYKPAVNHSHLPVSSSGDMVDITPMNNSNIQPKETNGHISKLDFGTAHRPSIQNSNLSLIQESFSDSSQKSQESTPSEQSGPTFRFGSSHILPAKQSSSLPLQQFATTILTPVISSSNCRFDLPSVSSIQRANFNGTEIAINKPLQKSNQPPQGSLPRIRFCCSPPIGTLPSVNRTPDTGTIYIRSGNKVIKKLQTLPENIRKLLKDKKCKFVPVKMADGKANMQNSPASGADKAKSFVSSLVLPKTSSTTTTPQVQVLILQSGLQTSTSGKPGVSSQLTSLTTDASKQTTGKPENNLQASMNRLVILPPKPDAPSQLQSAGKAPSDDHAKAGTSSLAGLDTAIAHRSNNNKALRPPKRKRQGGKFCCAINCSNAYYKEDCKDVSFFQFPVDKERCRMWVQNSRRHDWVNKPLENISRRSGYYLCSKHFEPSQFTVPSEKKRLIWNAVPTLFDVPNPPPSLTPKRKLRS